MITTAIDAVAERWTKKVAALPDVADTYFKNHEQIQALHHWKYELTDDGNKAFTEDLDASPQEDNDAVFRHAEQKLRPLMEHIDNLRDKLKQRAFEQAPDVTFKPDGKMKRVRRSSPSAYHSQGYGANRYARAALTPLQVRLETLGFKVEIRSVNEDSEYQGKTHTHTYYELWADAPRWMVDAAELSQSITEKADIIAQKERLHPQVLYPYSFENPAVSNPKW